MTSVPPTPEFSAVRFVNVCFAYGATPVVQNINIEFLSGCVHCIIGPNGSGKSTLAGLLIGMLVPQSGDIQIQGQSLAGLSADKRARLVALTPQRIVCPFDYSVREFIGMAPSPDRQNSSSKGPYSVGRLVQDAMELAGVVHLASRPFNELSVGEQQRAAIARMLAQDTPIMVLDEPTSALDIQHQLELLELARAVKEQGRCVIWITHDLHLALRAADYVVVLKDGAVAAAGTPDIALADDLLDAVFGVRRGYDHQPQFVLRAKSTH